MNKKTVLIALLALFCIAPASAKLRFGIKAGLNLDNIKLNSFKSSNPLEIIDTDNKCGFTAGAMMEATVPMVGIGFDLSLMYTHMNAEISNDTDEGSVGKNFLEIPLNLKYKLNIPVVNKIIQPMVFTGPTMAVKLDKSTWKNIKTKTIQMGWNLGVGVELFSHLQVSGGYTFGINNVVKYIPGVNNNLNLEDVKLKNNYWTVTAAYLF